MTSSPGLFQQIRAAAAADPWLSLALLAALVALATTPVAFAVLGSRNWFRARRGRTLQKPEFWSVVCSMLLVMGIPAIFALIALKSRHYDHSRYEFDPNQTISVLDQGRQYRTLKEADEAVRAERKRLDETRKLLVRDLEQLNTAMLGVRSSAGQVPAAIPSLRAALERIAALNRELNLDAPQQLLEELGTPAAIAGAAPSPAVGTVPAVAPIAAAPARAPVGAGLDAATREAELSSVPAPQRTVASYLPLSGLPAGWVVGDLGGKHMETFNADNLYEKIDGRAESFIQYSVVGMAYAFFHPEGDDSSEAQLYIYEMSNPLKAFGKYSSEKPDEAEPLPIGSSEGYRAAGSVFFHSNKYYIQISTTTEDPKLVAFAADLAKRVATAINPTATQSEAPSVAGAAPGAPLAAPAEATPEALFKLLPAGPGRTGEKYVAQDVFGYSFLSDVFLADYKVEKDYWQGFLRPYQTPEEAAAVFEKYLAAVKEFGAKVQVLDKVEGTDRMATSTLDGLVDAVFLKGNTLAGANGSTNGKAAEDFARAFAKTLPVKLPALPPSSTGENSTGETPATGEQ